MMPFHRRSIAGFAWAAVLSLWVGGCGQDGPRQPTSMAAANDAGDGHRDGDRPAPLTMERRLTSYAAAIVHIRCETGVASKRTAVFPVCAPEELQADLQTQQVAAEMKVATDCAIETVNTVSGRNPTEVEQQLASRGEAGYQQIELVPRSQLLCSL